MKQQPVENKGRPIKKHLIDKRNEFIFALSEQGYSYGEIGCIFKLDRAHVFRIVAAQPKGWKSPWVKRDTL